MDSPKLSRADLFWPLALLALASMVTLIALTLLMVRQFDGSAVANEQAIVENGLIGRLAEVAQLAAPMTEWDDAVRHLDNHYDPAWARQNIGAQLYQVDGFTDSVILLSDDNAVFAAHKGAPSDLDAYRPLVSRAKSLVSAVRQAELRRGPVLVRHDAAKMVATPIQSSTVATIDGDVVLLSATLVQPDFGTASISRARAPIILTSMTIDDDFLKAFAHRYQMKNIHLHVGDSRPESQEAHAPMIDDRGQVVATVDWTPNLPGTAMLQRLLSPVLLVVCVLELCNLCFNGICHYDHFIPFIFYRFFQCITIFIAGMHTCFINIGNI